MSQTATVSVNNNITVEDAAKILGCSYPHVINRINQGKIKAKKIGKSWLVDAEDVSRAKSTNLVKPRPRGGKKVTVDVVSNALDKMNHLHLVEQDEVTITIKLSRDKYQLINLALENKENKNLKEHLESIVDSLHEKIQKHLAGVDF